MAQGDWLNNPRNGVHYLTEAKEDFEASYLAVRTLEGRVLSDEEVRRLPDSNWLPLEWKKRAWTAQKFLSYLRKKDAGRVLEIGCGNGWFSNYLAHDSIEVFGLDVGSLELEQAARCFNRKGLYFLCCKDWATLPKGYFNLIVFNGSVHYFEPEREFWQRLMDLLSPKGEIHLLDTPVYPREEVSNARQRSVEYFSKLGEEKAAEYYHHLSRENLPENAEFLYRPSRILNRLNPTRSPFPWIRIQKESYTSR